MLQINPAHVGVLAIAASILVIMAVYLYRRLPPIIINFSAIHIKMDELRLKYGNFVNFRAGHRNMYFINEPEGVKRIMVENRTNYPKIKEAFYTLNPALGMGLLVSDGDLWTLHRKALAFIGYDEFKRAHFKAIEPAVRRFIEYCQAQGSNKVDLYTALDDCTTEVMCEIVLGEQMPPPVRKALAAMFAELENQVLKLFRYHKYLPSFKRTMKTLHTYVEGLIAERRKLLGTPALTARGDVLSRCVADNSDAMTDVELRDNLITLMFAGHDAIALALTFTTYLVSQHPEVAVKLREEADRILGDARFPTYEQVAEFTYSANVFKEGMRIFSPVPVFGRHALEDDIVCGQKVKAGSSIVLSSWSMHRREDLYPDALSFKPERWDTIKESSYEYFPFAVPPRSCLGRAFAHLEASVFLPVVFRELNIKPTKKEDGSSVKWKYGLTAQPLNGMWVYVSPRNGTAAGSQ